MKSQVLSQFYRSPPAANCDTLTDLAPESTFFQWQGITCYGRRARERAMLPSGPECRYALEFDPAAVVDNYRHEKYPIVPESRFWMSPAVRQTYYAVRPYLGVHTRRPLQRLYLRQRRHVSFPRWPVDTSVEDLCQALMRQACECSPDGRVPFIWFWPDGAESCVMMTHDIEETAGLHFCDALMDIDDAFDTPAAFQLVPESRYKIPPRFIDKVIGRGFEVNIQDLNHDGMLFDDKTEFCRRAARIDHYRLQFGARGFRSAVMYRNQNWYDQLHFDYDMSVPNVARFDPQHGGCCTVFPYFISTILELPLTTTQDYSLFHILGKLSIDLWKEQIELILKKNGLISFLVHPDYIIQKRERDIYINLLRFLQQLRSHRRLWFALPREVNDWWRQRSAMQLVNSEFGWTIRGNGSDRALTAFASIKDSQLSCELSPALSVVRNSSK